MHYQYSQKKAAAADRNTRERDYWLNQLAGQLTKAVFYYDYKNTNASNNRKENISFRLTGDIFVRLSQLSRNSPHALHMIVAAAITILLHRYTNLEDIIIGTPIYKQDIEGEFINTLLALRNRVEDNMTFKEFLLKVKNVVTEAVENQNYPIETLLYKLNMEFSPHDFPLFDVIVLVENVHDKKYIQHINPNVIFSFLQTHEEVEGVVKYNPVLYDQTSIARIIRHFTCLLQAVLTNLDLHLSSIPILSEKEKEQLLYEFNDSKRAFVRDRCYQQLFEELAAKGPPRTAAVHNDKHITYGELNGKSNQLASLLRKRGVTPDHLVAVLCERSIEMLIGIMGVFKAGGAYIPFEIDSPLQRMKTILKDSETCVLLTISPTAPDLEPFIKEICSGTNVNQVIYLDKLVEVGKYQGGNLKTVNQPENLSYVIYTSGTTGTPKGVMIHHQGMLNHVEAKINDLAITAKDVIAQTASACFDISVWQFLAGLLIGASTFIIDKESVLDPERLLRIIQKGKITIWESVPSLMTAFLHLVEYKSKKERELNHLRWMILTGEALGVHLVKEWYGCYPGIKVLNAYGPTEAADDVTHYVVQDIPSADRTPANVPIGKPIQNTHIYILDRNLSLCPVGVRGEICAAGVGVGRGYWKDPDKTGRSFITNPYSNEIGDPDYATLYKTGDIGYIGKDGNIHCLGRLDHQVKIRGYRIEPAEIENRLLNHVEISEAVVMVRTMSKAGEPVEDGQGGDGGNKYLCAYFVTKQGSSVSTAELREYLAGELPDYMVPSYFVRLEKLPLTANGKIDRGALPEPALEDAEEYIAPANAIEKRLVDIWADILGLEKSVISTNANFFEIGGHSLRATILTVKIHKEMDVKVPLIEIFQSTTIQALARYIENASIEKFNPLNPVEKREYYELSSAQKRLYIIQQMDVNSIVYNMPMIVPFNLEIPGLEIKKELRRIIQRLISRHETFRTFFSTIEFNTTEMQMIQGIKPPDEVNFEIECYELQESEVEKESLNGEIQNIYQEFVRPFDLSQAPLVRAGLLITKESRYILLVDMHHIISDLVSHDILTRDFIFLAAGRELPPLRLQYTDYTQWQNSDETKKSLSRQEEYWLNEYRGEIPLLHLPVDYERKKEMLFEGDSVSFLIDQALNSKIREQSRQIDVTVMMYLFSIYNILIARYCGQEELVVGTVAAGRQHADLGNIIGFFVNMLPIKTSPHPEKSFSQYLLEVKEKAVNAYENQGYPFEELVSKLDIPREPGRHPLVEAVFAFQNQLNSPVVPPENTQETFDFISFDTARFDLMLQAVDEPHALQMLLQYPRDLFKRSTIEEFTNFYLEILSQVVDNPGTKLKDIKLNLNLIAPDPVALQDDKDDWEL